MCFPSGVKIALDKRPSVRIVNSCRAPATSHIWISLFWRISHWAFRPLSSLRIIRALLSGLQRTTLPAGAVILHCRVPVRVFHTAIVFPECFVTNQLPSGLHEPLCPEEFIQEEYGSDVNALPAPESSKILAPVRPSQIVGPSSRSPVKNRPPSGPQLKPGERLKPPIVAFSNPPDKSQSLIS